MLNFPEEHHTSNLDCTPQQLFNHHYGQREINDQQCNDCTRKTTAHQCTFIRLQHHYYPPEDELYCPQHNKHYVKWVRFKAGEIALCDIGCDDTFGIGKWTMLNLSMVLANIGGSAIHESII